MEAFETRWRTVQTAAAIVLASPRRRLGAAVFSILFGAAFLLIPVFTIPGNTLEFWLAITPWWTYVFLAFYAGSMGVLAVMIQYVLQAGSSGLSVAGAAPGLVSGLYSTAACGGCLAGVFSFLGSGVSLFLLENRTPLLVVGMALTLFSLYYFSKKVNGKCETCHIKEAKGK